MSKLRQARDRKSQALRKVARPVKASAEITLGSQPTTTTWASASASSRPMLEAEALERIETRLEQLGGTSNEALQWSRRARSPAYLGALIRWLSNWVWWSGLNTRFGSASLAKARQRFFERHPDARGSEVRRRKSIELSFGNEHDTPMKMHREHATGSALVLLSTQSLSGQRLLARQSQCGPTGKWLGMPA